MVTDYFWPEKIGGIGIIVKNLAAVFDRLGHDVWILTSGKPDPYQTKVIKSSGNVKIAILMNYFILPKLIREIKPDIVNLHQSANAGLLFLKKLFLNAKLISSYQVCYSKERKQINPVKIGKHTYSPNLNEIFVKYFFSYIHWFNDHVGAKFADGISVVSRAVKKEISEYHNIASDNIRIIPNGVSPQDFYPTPPKDEYINRFKLNRGRVLLYVGAFYHRKRIFNLFHALKDIRTVLPDTRLIVIGSGRGYEERYRHYCSRMGLDRAVHFLGRVDNRELKDFYNLADIVIIPSSYEGMPIVLLEAMACARAVVATNVSGHPDVIEHGRNGILIPRDDIGALSRHIIDLLQKTSFRESLGLQSKKDMERDYNWNRIGERYINFFGEFLHS